MADSGDEFLLAQYSIYDEVAPSFHAAPKGHDLLYNFDTDETPPYLVVQRGLLQRVYKTTANCSSTTSGSGPSPAKPLIPMTTSSGSTSDRGPDAHIRV